MGSLSTVGMISFFLIFRLLLEERHRLHNISRFEKTFVMNDETVDEIMLYHSAAASAHRDIRREERGVRSRKMGDEEGSDKSGENE